MRSTWVQDVPLLLAAIGLFAGGCEQGGPAAKPPASDTASATKPADDPASVQPPLPEIKLDVIGFDGYQQLVKQNRGKVVFVDFWATW